MSFKDKPIKKKKFDSRVTIDVIHNDIINKFNDNINNKDNLLNELQLLENDFNETNDEKTMIKINKLKEQINNDDINDKYNYYLNNGEILFDYYENKSGEKKKDKNIKKNFIVELMSKEKNINENDDENLINEYMCNVNDNKIKNTLILNIDKCKICSEKITVNNIKSTIICENCGYTENIIVNTEKVSYKEPPRESSYFAYKRINHFNEWLAQFQAKETTDISEEIYKKIFSELKKDKFLDINNLKYQQIRDILKRLKYNKYYEHIPHIINVISGKKAPLLTRKYEEQFRMMFKEIQIPFLNNRPVGRKNFLSYSYVLHKFCELLQLDDLIVNFPLLKSREKLQQQDAIWKGICKDLKWEYIPSV